MTVANEDEDLANFFDSLLTDPTEREILKLILRGEEEDSIIEKLLGNAAGHETPGFLGGDRP